MLRPEPDTRAIVQPEPPLLLLLVGNLQPLAPPDPRDPFVVHEPACASQHRSDPPVAIATVLSRQFDDAGCQRISIRPALRNLALRGSVLSQCAAGAALRYAKRLPHMIDTATATRGAQKFPFAASVRISLSRVKSETALGRCWFSFSSSFRRLS